MSVAKVSSKGWIVIPAEYRKKYHLKPGDHVRVIDFGDVLAIVPLLKNPIDEAMGLLRGSTSLVEALLDERAREREIEEK